MAELSALALVCTLKQSPEVSSSELLATQVLGALAKHGVSTSLVRVADHNIPAGVAVQVDDSDEWPRLRQQILEANILLVATPIWLGHIASTTQKVLERLNADISETDEAGHPLMWGRVGIVAVVGNEDGAHKAVSDILQGLNDLGFTVPANAGTYWVGEAMGSTDYADLDGVPEKVASNNETVARTASHLARLLQDSPYR